MPLERAYAVDGPAPRAEVREALGNVEDGDVSKSSPISAGAQELAVLIGTHDGQNVVVVREQGHEGEWTKTSQTAVDRAVKSVGGVGDLVYAEAGYDGGE